MKENVEINKGGESVNQSIKHIGHLPNLKQAKTNRLPPIRESGPSDLAIANNNMTNVLPELNDFQDKTDKTYGKRDSQKSGIVSTE